MRSLLCAATLIALAASAISPGPASASGGRYVFVGGTTYERNQVAAALKASSFNWNVIPTVTVVISGAQETYSTPGVVNLNAGLLDSGQFSWGTVLQEFAHQLDFSVLTDADRAALQQTLGGQFWYGDEDLYPTVDLAAERFATMVSVAYWPSYWGNCFYPRPGNQDPENDSMSLASFRTLLNGLLAQDHENQLRPSTDAGS